MQIIRFSTGYMLVEVTISLLILSIGMLGVNKLLLTTIQRMQQVAVHYQQLEQIRQQQVEKSYSRK